MHVDTVSICYLSPTHSYDITYHMHLDMLAQQDSQTLNYNILSFASCIAQHVIYSTVMIYMITTVPTSNFMHRL